MGSAVTITPDEQPSAGPVTITPDPPGLWQRVKTWATTPGPLQENQSKPTEMPGSFEGHPENVGEYIPASAGEMAGGARDVARGDIAKGMHRVVSGVSNAALPVLPFVAAGAPVATGTAMLFGTAGQQIGKSGAKALGATEDQSDLAGDIGGLASGYGGAKLGGTVEPYIKPVAGALAKGYAKKLIPKEAFDAYDAVKTARNAPKPPAPEATSPSRTMPGQVGREFIAPDQVTPPAKLRPDQLRLPEQTPSTIEGAVNSRSRSIGGEKTVNQKPQPAKPIPPRSGLALPAKPVGSELQDLPATNAKPAAQTGEALGTIRSSSAVQTPKPIQRGSLSQLLQQQLNEGLGAAPPPNPKAPIYQRGQLSSAMQEGSDVPQGHTAVEGSSAIRSKMYDPAAREFHARLTSGDTTYVYGDVSPEEASGFEGAKSKGQAFQAMKANHPLVAKIVNGKRMPVKVSR
jgi:hypothetical protein